MALPILVGIGIAAVKSGGVKAGIVVVGTVGRYAARSAYVWVRRDLRKWHDSKIHRTEENIRSGLDLWDSHRRHGNPGSSPGDNSGNGNLDNNQDSDYPRINPHPPLPAPSPSPDYPRISPHPPLPPQEPNDSGDYPRINPHPPSHDPDDGHPLNVMSGGGDDGDGGGGGGDGDGGGGDGDAPAPPFPPKPPFGPSPHPGGPGPGGPDLDDDDDCTPLILDLDGNGVEAGEIVFFDHEGDGFMEATRWASGSDAVLAWDRDGDGVISDGSELFGNNTVLANGQKANHGFAALAELDSNRDGIFDANDAEWENIKVVRWTDGDPDDDQDVKDTLETVSLADVDVQSLDISYEDSSYVDEYGNEHRQVGSYTRTDGTTATMTDVWFDRSTRATVYLSDIPERSENMAALPDVTGSGQVYDLRDAMALDAAGKLKPPFYSDTRTETRTLEQMVSDFAAVDESGAPALDKAAREVLAEKILLRWTGAEGATDADYWADRRGLFYTEAHKIAVLEAFQGRQWRAGESYRNPALSTAQKINLGYSNYLRLL